MPKFTTPQGCQGVHISGAWFPVDKDGVLTLPEQGNYVGMLPEGFEPYVAPKTDGVFPAVEAPVAEAVVEEQAPAAKAKK